MTQKAVTRTIYVSDAAIYKLAQEQAKREGKSISQVIQEYLDSYITQNKKAASPPKDDKPFYIG